MAKYLVRIRRTVEEYANVVVETDDVGKIHAAFNDDPTGNRMIEHADNTSTWDGDTLTASPSTILAFEYATDTHYPEDKGSPVLDLTDKEADSDQ